MMCRSLAIWHANFVVKIPGQARNDVVAPDHRGIGWQKALELPTGQVKEGIGWQKATEMPTEVGKR